MNYVTSDHVTWKILPEGSVLLDLNSSLYYTLNATATEVWRGVADGVGVETIAGILAGQYDVGADQAKADVEEQLAFFASEGLISEVAASKTVILNTKGGRA